MDNRARVIYGQVYVDDYDREDRAARIAADVLAAAGAAYKQEAAAARNRGQGLPPVAATTTWLKTVIGGKVQRD